MNCPVCSEALVEQTDGDETVDYCMGCQGIWFDSGELGTAVVKMLEVGTISGQTAREAFGVQRVNRDEGGNPGARMCPRCEVPMKAFNYSYDSNVFLDKCPECGGVWADAGEIVGVAKYIKGNPAVNRMADAIAATHDAGHKVAFAYRLLQSRWVSGMVALLYLAIAAIGGEPRVVFNVLLFIIMPLACIWFSEPMGRYVGCAGIGRPAVTKPTPGIVVAIGGWILLLSPVILAVFCAIF